jgi:hypothetical protein
MSLVSIPAFILAFYFFWHAIQSLFYKRTMFIFPFKIDLWLTRKFQSQEAAQEYMNRMSEPKKVFWSGINAFITAIFLLFVSVYYLFN